MREWVPVSTSPKGRLVLAAVGEFGRRPYADVTVGELARQAEVTTGALYHHFDSKIGLYAFVREDVEKRLLDRISGAVAVTDDVMAALVVGFDFAVAQGFLHILGAPPEPVDHDRLTELVAELVESAPLGRLLTASWRAALAAVADGVPADQVRAALQALQVTGAGRTAP
ncbi:TetR/AcrR family transcriptional regulator [Microlunatus sp. Y2014]|uniref:TetR/AcrR family transcriptional regulator n=1 Tax=Microlunatus sp. Y2014 TaxID=3418488 RepID=UPI003DA6F589